MKDKKKLLDHQCFNGPLNMENSWRDESYKRLKPITKNIAPDTNMCDAAATIPDFPQVSETIPPQTGSSGQPDGVNYGQWKGSKSWETSQSDNSSYADYERVTKIPKSHFQFLIILCFRSFLSYQLWFSLFWPNWYTRRLWSFMFRL